MKSTCLFGQNWIELCLSFCALNHRTTSKFDISNWFDRRSISEIWFDVWFDLIWRFDIAIFDAKMYTISVRFTLIIKTPGPGRTINIRVYTTFTIGEILFSSSGARSDRFHWGEASFYLKETHSLIFSYKQNVISREGNALMYVFNEVKRNWFVSKLLTYGRRVVARIIWLL